MVCTKCNIDKPETEYGTYYHRTQNKIRTRKYCKSCYSKQQKKIKMRIKQSKLIKCWSCNQELEPKFFYEYNRARCRKCLDRASRMAKLQKSGGSSLIPNKPNIYTDKFQKEQVFDFLKLMGYLYDEQKGVWLKPGVKEIEEDKIVFRKIKIPGYKNNYGKGVAVRPEIRKEIMEEYKKGNKIKDLCLMFNLSYSAIYKIVTKYERRRI